MVAAPPSSIAISVSSPAGARGGRARDRDIF
jgi:hypothetical protein